MIGGGVMDGCPSPMPFKELGHPIWKFTLKELTRTLVETRQGMNFDSGLAIDKIN